MFTGNFSTVNQSSNWHGRRKTSSTSASSVLCLLSNARCRGGGSGNRTPPLSVRSHGLNLSWNSNLVQMIKKFQKITTSLIVDLQICMYCSIYNYFRNIDFTNMVFFNIKVKIYYLMFADDFLLVKYCPNSLAWNFCLLYYSLTPLAWSQYPQRTLLIWE